MQNFYHLKVNHSINFVDESTDAHTNAIESSWRHAKESFSSHGRKKEHVPGNLARHMFQKSCRANNTDPTEAFFKFPDMFTILQPMKHTISETQTENLMEKM